MEAPPALRLTGVAMDYPDGMTVLRGVDLTLRAGEFVSVVGPSGCGKSTLLRIASGLVVQTAGEVAVDRTAMGYTFQDATLMPWRRVLGNVELLMELRGLPAPERRRIAREQIALVGLSGFEAFYPRHLSGGMRMRVSLARSLALDPSVFLFDEPFGALDEISRQRLNDELAALYRARGFAGLFITHSIAEAVYLSTRVAVMSPRPGRILAEFDVPFDWPRRPELRYDPAFTRLAGDIAQTLRQAMAA